MDHSSRGECPIYSIRATGGSFVFRRKALCPSPIPFSLEMRSFMSVIQPRPLLLVLTLLMACASSPPPRAGPSPATAVSRLGWLTGRWHAVAAGTFLEETWSAPEGESMVGMFRAVQAGTAGFYEMMAFEREGDAVFLRMVHFGLKLAPHHGDSRTLDYALVETDGVGRATFETSSPERVRRTVWRTRSPSPC
jgi:hypothetical protein